MPIARTNADAVHLPPGEVAPVARERLIVQALRQDGPATPEVVIAPTGLSQSATYADLPMLADRGVIVAHTVYALPGQRVGAR
jgi:hypothetical protein